MNRKTKDINESELKNWRLLKEFRKLFDGILKDRPRSKSEDDPRRQIHFLDYATSILIVFCNPFIIPCVLSAPPVGSKKSKNMQQRDIRAWQFLRG